MKKIHIEFEVSDKVAKYIEEFDGSESWVWLHADGSANDFSVVGAVMKEGRWAGDIKAHNESIEVLG